MKIEEITFVMKRTNNLILSLFSIAILCNYGLSQCNIIPNAIPNLTLTFSVGVNNATGVAFNPNLNLYYIAQAGNPGFPLQTFDVAGAPLYQTNTGFDMRGLWWNPNLNQLESNGYNTGGIWSYDLNGSGYGLNTGTSIFTGLNQPTAQSVGDYNCVDDEIWYYNAGTIMKRNRATNALIGTFPITGLPVATANLNNNTVFYTDCLGHEIGLVDYVLKRIYFVDKTTMAYTGMSILPAGTVTNNSFRASWANGMVWLLNSANATWYSFEVLTGFNTNCSVIIVCTPPTIVIDDQTECSPNTVDLNDAINPASSAGPTTFYSTAADANAAINPISNSVATSGAYYVRIEDPTDPTCFSVATINVQINPSYNSNENYNTCENSVVVYPDGSSEVISANTSHTSNLLTALGCDSVIVTNVTMDPVYNTIENIDACENSTVVYPDGFSEVIVASTSHNSNLLTVAGCDSIIVTNVNMVPNYNTIDNINACENTTVTYPDGFTEVITANSSHTSNLLTAGGCDSIIVTNVTMDPLADAGTNGAISYCTSSASSDLFMELGGTPTAGGSWSPGLTSGTGMFNPAADPSGTYTYSVTNGCGTATADVIVTITTSPDPGTNGTLTVCSSDPTTNLYTVLGGTPDMGGTWSPALASGTGTFNPAVDPSGIYTYDVSNACGSFTSQVAVTVYVSEDASFSYPSTVYCLDDPNPTATILGTPGGIFTISGTGSINATTGEIDIIASGVGGFAVEYTTSGACPDVFVYDITILNNANATITPVGPFCDSDSPITLQAISPGGTWSGTGVDPVSGVFDPAMANTGMNTITYSISGQCGDVQSIQINVVPAPIVATIPDTTITFGDSVVLTSVSSVTNYEWSPSTWLDCSTCISPVSTPSETITYTITVEENGCFASDEVTIIVLYDPVVFVPNIFSPNGDNNNDILYVRGKGIVNLRFIVYDRWGEKVFESTSLQEGWDGRFRGKKMNPGVFMYYVDVDFENGTSVSKKGDVTLIR